MTVKTQIPLPIIYEDEHILILEKPPGVLDQSENESDKDLTGLALDYVSHNRENPYAALIHGLEQTMGGIIVLAKDRDSAAKLSLDRLNNDFSRSFLAVVKGRARRNLIIRNQIAKGPRGHYITISLPVEGAREGLITYDLIEKVQTADDGVLSLVLITPQSRFYHIPSQLASVGLPVFGDSAYGQATGSKSLARQAFVFPALWCHKFTMIHPGTNETLNFVSKPRRKYPFDLFDLERLGM